MESTLQIKQHISLHLQHGMNDLLKGIVDYDKYEAFVKGEVNHELVMAKSCVVIDGQTKLQFHTLFDCIQSIFLFNCQVVNSTLIEFINPNTKTKCAIDVGEGFGDDSSPLCVQELVDEFGFIPHYLLNRGLFDIHEIHCLHACCQKCSVGIHVLGFDPNLRFWIGRCPECKYESSDGCLPSSAIHINGEKFTRLVEANHGDESELFVQLPEIIQRYENANDLCYAVWCSMLWEKSHIRRLFDASGVSAELIESSVQPGQLTKILMLKLKIKRTDIWNTENLKRIGSVNVRLHVFGKRYPGRSDLKFMNSTNFWLDEEDNTNYCILKVRIDLDEEFGLQDGQKIMVTPTFTEVMYEAMMDVLSKLQSGLYSELPLTRAIMMKTLNANEVRSKSEYTVSLLENMYFFRLSLTASQNQILERVLSNEVTVVGKELESSSDKKFITSAAIILMCMLSEPKHRALVIGADEKICNDLCDTLEDVIGRFLVCGKLFNVLRILTKVDAIRMRADRLRSSQEYIRYLHEEIDDSISNKKDGNKTKIQLKVLQRGQYYEMGPGDQCNWIEGTSRLEKNIVKSTDNLLIVGTPQAIVESQVIPAFSGDRHHFNTLVFEHARGITLDKIIPLLPLKKISRIILIEGDATYPSPQALTVSAGLAGIQTPISKLIKQSE